MQIPKEWVDSFETGREIPSCQIRAEWTKPGKPSKLKHKVTLIGAKKFQNYFYIVLDSILPDTTGGEFMAQAICVLVLHSVLHHSVIISNALVSALLWKY